MTCCDVFQACNTKMLPTLRLRTGRLPVLTVMFTQASFLSSMVSLCVRHVRRWCPGTPQPDRQAVEIHNRTVSRYVEPRSGYTVVEGQ